MNDQNKEKFNYSLRRLLKFWVTTKITLPFQQQRRMIRKRIKLLHISNKHCHRISLRIILFESKGSIQHIIGLSSAFSTWCIIGNIHLLHSKHIVDHKQTLDGLVSIEKVVGI